MLGLKVWPRMLSFAEQGLVNRFSATLLRKVLAERSSVGPTGLICGANLALLGLRPSIRRSVAGLPAQPEGSRPRRALGCEAAKLSRKR